MRGPLVMFVPGRVTCPLAGIGERAANASNRLVIDHTETEVTITGSRITIRDDRNCAPNTPIVDLVWLADGIDRAGRRTPFTIHLEVTKTGRAYAIDLHTHEPAHLPRESVDYEPFEVVADREVLVDARRLANVATKQPLSRRLAQAMTTTRDHLQGVRQDPREPGYRVVDRSIGIGAFGRGLLLVRARLTSLAASNAELIASESLVRMLHDGKWELSIEALTERVLPDLVKRDLFLYGLESVPVLATVRERGLRVHQALAFRCVEGAGELRLDDARSPLPDALDIARAYLEFHMLGRMIVEAVP